MTIELLDTDTEQGGEMAEVERWSEYVDKYLCIGDISDELKQQLARKPVFLSRLDSFSLLGVHCCHGHCEVSGSCTVCLWMSFQLG